MYELRKDQRELARLRAVSDLARRTMDLSAEDHHTINQCEALLQDVVIEREKAWELAREKIWLP